MSSFSSCDWTDKTSVSVSPSLFEYGTSDMDLSVDDETGTQKNETSSVNWERESRYFSVHSINECNNKFTERPIDNDYSVNNIYSGPFCLMKSYDSNVSSNDT